MLKQIRDIKLKVVLFIFAGVVSLGPHHALAATCADLKYSIATITANGYQGKLNFSSNTSLPSISGTIKFTGESTQSFTGTCNGRHITFTRNLPSGISQIYDGWISTKPNTKQYAGVFSHGKSSQRYPWCGSWVETPR